MTETAWTALAVLAAAVYVLCCFVAALWALEDYWCD